ncbi:MAG TPA: FAD:protein FMN transferase [Acidimicrobiales bacterium]
MSSTTSTATVGARSTGPTDLQFRAMGSAVHVIVVGGPPGLADWARARIDDLEHRWSRFLPDSEVSELNRRAGSPVVVSADTIELVERATEACRVTGGSFDATVLGDVIRAGYDRPFDDLAGDRPSPQSILQLGGANVVVDGSTVRLPAGTGFDPGGIGKGLAADIVVREAMAGGARGMCVNLGGDLRVAGEPPSGDAWTVSVQHAWQDDPVVLVGLHDGAVATSTTLRRRWTTDGQPKHHLIDPGTGQPSTSDLNLVSVIGASGWVAEVLAKAVLLRGSAHPFDLIGGSGAEALAVTSRGQVLASDGLGAFLGDRPLPERLHGAPILPKERMR